MPHYLGSGVVVFVVVLIVVVVVVFVAVCRIEYFMENLAHELMIKRKESVPCPNRLVQTLAYWRTDFLVLLIWGQAWNVPAIVLRIKDQMSLFRRKVILVNPHK